MRKHSIVRFTGVMLFSVIPVLAVFQAEAQETINGYRLLGYDSSRTVFDVKMNELQLQVVPFKNIHYVHFALIKPAVLSVGFEKTITGYEIEPKSGASIQLVNDKLLLSISRAGYYVIRINRQYSLFVFADKPFAGPDLKSPQVKNILDYGVDNSGAICETRKLQLALDDIAGSRMTLYFPPGIYRTGTLKIRSNSRVFLEAGAILQGSDAISDYPVDSGRTEFKNFNDANGRDNGEIMTFSRLILIDNARNIKLWGRGVIDGNGARIRHLGKPANLIRIRNSSHVVIAGLTLRDPAAWNTHVLFSRHVQLNDLKILNDPSIRNTDGIDPDASQNIRVRHCFAYCADDNIAVKASNNSGLLQNVKNISVENCVFLTKKSALKIGTETKSARIRNVVFKNNEIIEADRGIVLYCYDGAAFSKIRFTGNRFVYGFRDAKQKAIHFEIRERSGKGRIDHVLIKNCVFEKTFHADSQMSGLNEAHAISNVRIKNTILHGKLCTGMADLRLRTNAFVKKIRFGK